MPVTGHSDIFSGARLLVAREYRGMTQGQLGNAVSASGALISLCENEKKKGPAADLVEAFGDVLGFSPGFFYRPIEDSFSEVECSFRHRRSTPEKYKAQIRAHGTLIVMVIEKLRSVVKFPVLNIPRKNAATVEEIETAAEDARNHWGLGIDRPLLHVGRVLEHAAVIIVGHVGQTPKVDAFSRNGKTAIIFLNQEIKSTSCWNFDIGHECGHLVMHYGIPTGSVETERAADRFAGAFLMPAKAFSRDFLALPFSWQHIFNLKKRWQASASAIVRRAYDLGLLGAVEYRRAFKYISVNGWRRGEPSHTEPDFQSPELLDAALKALGSKQIQLTIADLCSELHFAPATFKDVTGVTVPPGKRHTADVLSFRATS